MPNIADIAGSLKKLGYYWQGGFGVQSTETGGDLTWAGAGLFVRLQQWRHASAHVRRA